MSPKRGGVWARLAVTLGAALGVPLLARIPLPGFDDSAIRHLDSYDPTMMGIFSFGLNPFVSGALFIEVMALLVPHWRVWRVGGYPERDRLWARVRVFALALAALQAFFLLLWMTHSEATYKVHIISWSGHRTPLLVIQHLSLVAGVFLLYWFTRLLDWWGAGNGFAVLAAALIAPSTVDFVSLVKKRLDAGDRVLLPLLAAAVAVAAATRLAGGRALSGQPAGARGNGLPAFSSGVHPVNLGHSLVMFPYWLTTMGLTAVAPLALAHGTWPFRAAEAALIAATCALLAWLFNRPRVVAEVWDRARDPAQEGEPANERVRGAFARSLAQSIGICWGLAAVDWLCADAGVPIQIVNLVILSCVAMDVVSELRFRHRHGALVPVWPVHRLYQLQGLLGAFDAASIPAFPRGRHYRTLWNYMAPFVPVDILVPTEHAARASEVLRQAGLPPPGSGDEPSPPSASG